MRRNAILAGFLSLLLSITAVFLAAPSVAKDVRPATTAHTAALRSPSTLRTPHTVASSRKVQRTPLAASVVRVTVASAYHPAVDHAGITENHKKLATTVLNALPASCRDHLQNFMVLYKGATRRGLGGKTTIILDGSVPDSEFMALLVHECGHVIHGNLLGSASAPKTTFKDGNETFATDSPLIRFWQISWLTDAAKRAGGQDADFISGYAQSDAFEEFAETFAAYVLERSYLRERAAENPAIASKLAWMEENVPLPENVLGTGSASWDGTVPWDVTKLAWTIGTL